MAANIYPQQDQRSAVVISQGSAPVGLTLQQTITSSGSVTIPAGINYVYALLIGGGGGGAGAPNNTSAGGGGGGGGVTYGWATAATTCTIGAGGAGGAGGTAVGS